MKTLSLSMFSSVVVLALTHPAWVRGQEADTPKTEPSDAPAQDVQKSTGVTFSLDDAEILVSPRDVKIPLTFVRTHQTPLVDDGGTEVSWEQLKAGIPVTVYYTMLDQKMFATKVVVTRQMIDGGQVPEPVDADARERMELAAAKERKNVETAARAKTLPSVNSGTIMGFEQVIVVSDGTGGPVTQYVVNNSTQYVDSAGKPVPPVFVRTGGRVDVRFVEDSGRKIATQFVVHRVAGRQTAATQSGTVRAGNAASQTATVPDYSGAVASTVWLDQNGNIIPGSLENGFLHPPLTMLPGNQGVGTTVAGNGQTGVNQQQPGVTNQTNTIQPNSTQTNAPQANQPQPNQPQPNERSGVQPGNQPATPQPNARQPNNQQPGTRQPSTPPGSGNSAPTPAPPSGRR